MCILYSLHFIGDNNVFRLLLQWDFASETWFISLLASSGKDIHRLLSALVSFHVSDNKTGNSIVALLLGSGLHPKTYIIIPFSPWNQSSDLPEYVEGSGYDLEGSGSGDWSEQGNAEYQEQWL